MLASEAITQLSAIVAANGDAYLAVTDTSGSLATQVEALTLVDTGPGADKAVIFTLHIR